MSGVAVSVVPPTTDAADLAKIVCEACWAHFRSWGAWPGITVHSESDLTWTEAADPARILQPGLWRAVPTRRDAATDIDNRDAGRPSRHAGDMAGWT